VQKNLWYEFASSKKRCGFWVTYLAKIGFGFAKRPNGELTARLLDPGMNGMIPLNRMLYRTNKGYKIGGPKEHASEFFAGNGKEWVRDSKLINPHIHKLKHTHCDHELENYGLFNFIDFKVALQSSEVNPTLGFLGGNLRWDSGFLILCHREFWWIWVSNSTWILGCLVGIWWILYLLLLFLSFSKGRMCDWTA